MVYLASDVFEFKMSEQIEYAEKGSVSSWNWELPVELNS